MRPGDAQQPQVNAEIAGSTSATGFNTDLDIRVQAAAQAAVRSQIPNLAVEVAKQLDLRAQNNTGVGEVPIHNLTNSNDSDIDSSDSNDDLDPEAYDEALQSGERISFNIDLALKQEIWTRKYVNFGRLVPKRGKKKEKKGKSVNVTTQDDLSLEDWLSGFLVYMDIYLEKYPGDTHGMISYMAYCRELGASNLFAMNRYDQSFRRKRALKPLPWGEVNIQSFAKAMNPSPNMRPMEENQKSKPCWRYNSGDCRSTPASCRYGHFCQLCGHTHPKFACRQSARSLQSFSGQICTHV